MSRQLDYVLIINRNLESLSTELYIAIALRNFVCY